ARLIIAFCVLSDATATADCSPLPLHDALPISRLRRVKDPDAELARARREAAEALEEAQARLAEAEETRDAHETRVREAAERHARSEEHTSELQSRENLVCRLLLEKTK